MLFLVIKTRKRRVPATASKLRERSTMQLVMIYDRTHLARVD